MPDAYSIRESLQGALQDFVREGGFNCVHLEEIIREIVSLLAVYREEDHLLFPEVFVFASPDGLKALAPSSDEVTIGSASLSHQSAALVLRNCAPLAVGGWAIFIVREDDENIRYGLFRSLRHSLSTGAEESMGDLGTNLPVMLIRNRGSLVVELCSTSNKRFTATLRTTVAKPSALEEDVSRFVEAVASKVQDPERFKPFLSRLLTEILQRCHGTLLGVVEYSESGTIHETLNDGIWFTPHLTLAALQTRAQTTHDADALADLKAAEALLAGMVNSDGVVIFGTDGTVIAYHVFLKANSDEVTKLVGPGGGRRRTYDLMKLRLQSVFKAVLYRSQDGEMACDKVDQ